MILKPAPVSTRQLHYDPDTNRYFGEISSTNGFGRVYDDSCDEGLTLVAPNGREDVFVVETTCRSDGEITGWTLVPADRTHRGSCSITLFND